MSNDPDLLEEDCPDCEGRGWIPTATTVDESDEDCATCGGNGVVLR